MNEFTCSDCGGEATDWLSCWGGMAGSDPQEIEAIGKETWKKCSTCSQEKDVLLGRISSKLLSVLEQSCPVLTSWWHIVHCHYHQ